jgi:flavorubredoxin
MPIATIGFFDYSLDPSSIEPCCALLALNVLERSLMNPQSSFQAVKIADNVYWVGAVDWSVRDFHGYLTSRGTTYNAFLITADKVTLIDTVKRPFLDEMMSRISSVIDPAKIDIIVSNHAELDHSGALPSVIKAVNPSHVYASSLGQKALLDHFHEFPMPITTVKDGERLSLGNKHLTFLETKMLHWPDSMVSYLEEDQILFSQDGFGMHLASSERFADELPAEILEYEAAKYFANILLPFSGFVNKLGERLLKLNLPFKMIAPDHGPIWRNGHFPVIQWWLDWAKQKRDPRKALVGYDTMWESTELMARAIGEGLTQSGAHVKLINFRTVHRSDIATEMLDTRAFVVGSPTINNNIYPTVADVLSYIKGLRPIGMIGNAFGSYGWSGESIAQTVDYLKAMNIELVGDPVKVKYVPRAEDLEKCRQMGRTIAAAMGMER